jgi:phosphotransferase system HPr (HPr) family protein
MPTEGNSQAQARTLLRSALHRIARISNRISLVKISIYLRREGTRSWLSTNAYGAKNKFPMMSNNLTNELTRHVTITNDLGLHARSAAKIAKLAQDVKSKVWIIKDGQKADAASVIDILSLACPKGTTITLKIEDPSDTGMLDNLVQLIENGFGE